MKIQDRMNLKAKVERDEKVPIKKVNNRTHFFERVNKTKEVQTWNLLKNLHDPIFGRKNFTH